MAEAGPEHIKLMNGRAVVTPLSGKGEKHTRRRWHRGQQTNNFTTTNHATRGGVARDLNPDWESACARCGVTEKGGRGMREIKLVNNEGAGVRPDARPDACLQDISGIGMEIELKP